MQQRAPWAKHFPLHKKEKKKKTLTWGTARRYIKNTVTAFTPPSMGQNYHREVTVKFWMTQRSVFLI
jgi:hypothetical protein